ACLMPLFICAAASAQVQVTVNHTDDHSAATAPPFTFKQVPAPAKDDLAAGARFTVLDGTADSNGGGLGALHDGNTPAESDDPAANLFFDQGTDGGRIAIDLGGVVEVRQVNTYSWHPSSRGPQVYRL